jgi:hypothetical protein
MAPHRSRRPASTLAILGLLVTLLTAASAAAQVSLPGPDVPPAPTVSLPPAAPDPMTPDPTPAAPAPTTGTPATPAPPTAGRVAPTQQRRAAAPDAAAARQAAEGARRAAEAERRRALKAAAQRRRIRANISDLQTAAERGAATLRMIGAAAAPDRGRPVEASHSEREQQIARIALLGLASAALFALALALLPIAIGRPDTLQGIRIQLAAISAGCTILGLVVLVSVA